MSLGMRNEIWECLVRTSTTKKRLTFGAIILLSYISILAIVTSFSEIRVIWNPL